MDWLIFIGCLLSIWLVYLIMYWVSCLQWYLIEKYHYDPFDKKRTREGREHKKKMKELDIKLEKKKRRIKKLKEELEERKKG